MRAARKLRIVQNCPMPDPPPAKPIVYGAAPWSRLPHTPPAHEINVRYRAQSLLSRDGRRAELPDYETALRIIAAANRPKRVTVPSPRESPRAASTGQGGAFPSRHAADDGESRDFMAVNAQADAQACVGTFAEGRETSVPIGRSLASTEYQAGDQHRPLPPYSHTLAGVPAKESQ